MQVEPVAAAEARVDRAHDLGVLDGDRLLEQLAERHAEAANCVERARAHTGHHGGGHDRVERRHGQQHLPAEAHELVVAQARHRGADPDEDRDRERGASARTTAARAAPTGPPQPPKKSVTTSAERTIMLMYSAIWKRPQRMPLSTRCGSRRRSPSRPRSGRTVRAPSRPIAAMKKTAKPTAAGRRTTSCRSACRRSPRG